MRNIIRYMDRQVTALHLILLHHNHPLQVSVPFSDDAQLSAVESLVSKLLAEPDARATLCNHRSSR